MRIIMKTLRIIERALLASLVALTLGVGLAPRAQAANTSEITMRSHHMVAPDADKGKGPKAGEETHG